MSIYTLIVCTNRNVIKTIYIGQKIQYKWKCIKCRKGLDLKEICRKVVLSINISIKSKQSQSSNLKY